MANTPSKKFMLVKALGKIKRVFFKIGLQKNLGFTLKFR